MLRQLSTYLASWAVAVNVAGGVPVTAGGAVAAAVFKTFDGSRGHGPRSSRWKIQLPGSFSAQNIYSAWITTQSFKYELSAVMSIIADAVTNTVM